MPPEGQRGANYPPRGGMGPGNRGRPNMARGGGPPGPSAGTAQRSMTMPNSGVGGRGMPQRPATTTGNRPPPQRTYPQDTQGPPQHQYNNAGYGDDGYGGAYHNSAIDDVYDSYYDEPRASISSHNSQTQTQGHARQESRSSMPDFDAIPVDNKRDSFEQSMRPAEQTKLNHARSMGDMRGSHSGAFEMTGDIPQVPPIPQSHAYQQGYDQGYGQGYDQGHDQGYNGYSQPPIPRGPSAPPGPAGQHPGFGNSRPPIVRPGTAAPANPDGLPAHPTPVRPGLMENSPVNPNAKPPPIRNYGGGPQMGQQQMRYSQQSQQQQLPPPPVQEKEREPPVTPGELEHLRMIIKGNPNDQASALKLAKRLIEASDVLIPNIPDPRGRNKARERYLMDAHKILKKLVASQNPDAMFVMADGSGRGLFGPESDAKEAFSLYQSAAKLGHAAAAYRTAVCCEIGHEEGGGTRKDPMKAIQWYKRAATLGDPPAMYKVGMILLKGLLGQPKNPREAVGWLKRAAERADAENPHALHELGLLYESAQGNDVIIRDEQYALTLFQQAAEIGYKFSQFRLGCAYEYGLLGCPIDPRLSIVWYSRAAQQEEHQSELALSGWYLTGSEGVLGQSDTEAYLWARKAAVAGLAKAEYAMGYFTEVGIGVPANLEDAKRWYWRAAAQDFPKARERLEDLKRSGKERARPRERISRSSKQQEGDCVLM
ncbi:uncharacterized protein TRIVIDRAFT_81698 [Trichoderma virens Gv29-8]|uniref:Chitin synthase activator n=1 Tax=Hypocrea virens (strain Gv29-8 / FGSC 10586) TaxID=413071 RepID=G9MQS6_HYPVG|nr:uncharacterized protein TRIVIDRAFT_81698 [Trichoderma virens Gv29-8]EHK22455.1 hypothetical protein TRIVIDRAFT_81698 [Trichoderma virens Gv29-8]